MTASIDLRPQGMLLRPQGVLAPRFAADPDLDLVHPRLIALLAFWQGMRDGDGLPRRADFEPADLVPHLPHLVLTDVAQQPLRLRYRLIGTAVTKAMGRDRTGSHFHELYPPAILGPMEAGFRYILEERRPLRAHGRAMLADNRPYDFELLNLPLASDGERIDMVLHELALARADRRPA